MFSEVCSISALSCSFKFVWWWCGWWWYSQRLLSLNPTTVMVVLLLGLCLLLGCDNKFYTDGTLFHWKLKKETIFKITPFSGNRHSNTCLYNDLVVIITSLLFPQGNDLCPLWRHLSINSYDFNIFWTYIKKSMVDFLWLIFYTLEE